MRFLRDNAFFEKVDLNSKRCYYSVTPTPRKVIKDMLKVGEMAVYPAHGAVVVDRIETKDISGIKKTFYILKVLNSDITVMVPTDNVVAVGLRPIISRKEVRGIYEILKKREANSLNGYRSWNKRYRQYAEKLKSGNLTEVAEVLRDIHLLQDEKELSFGERRMMDTARNLLVTEISIAKDAGKEVVTRELEKLLNQ